MDRKFLTTIADDSTTDADTLFSRPSRTRLKRSAENLRKVGEDLINLPEGKFTKLVVPEELRLALIEARRDLGFIARKRLLQTVGRCMESVDVAAIRAQLAVIDHLPAASAPPAPKSAYTDLANQLFDDGDPAVFALSDRFDRTALQTLRQTVRQANKAVGPEARTAAVGKIVAVLERLEASP